MLCRYRGMYFVRLSDGRWFSKNWAMTGPTGNMMNKEVPEKYKKMIEIAFQNSVSTSQKYPPLQILNPDYTDITTPGLRKALEEIQLNSSFKKMDEISKKNKKPNAIEDALKNLKRKKASGKLKPKSKSNKLLTSFKPL